MAVGGGKEGYGAGRVAVWVGVEGLCRGGEEGDEGEG